MYYTAGVPGVFSVYETSPACWLGEVGAGERRWRGGEGVRRSKRVRETGKMSDGRAVKE